MFRVSLGEEVEISKNTMKTLACLGWYADGRPTELGELVEDPLREYAFWRDRNKLLPSEENTEALKRQNFTGKSVLELGSGGGCNLLSLIGVPYELTGVEPMPVYRQLTPVLAELSGIEVPDVVEGTAENIPVDDNHYDFVLCFTSHQYMDINISIKEIRRVLTVGGQLIIVGDELNIL